MTIMQTIWHNLSKEERIELYTDYYKSNKIWQRSEHWYKRWVELPHPIKKFIERKVATKFLGRDNYETM